MAMVSVYEEGFFGRGKLQPLSRMTVLKNSRAEWHNTGKEQATSPCHSEQAVFNKNTNMKPW